MTKYGRPSSVVPPSSSMAMFGWLEAGEDLALVAEAAEDGVGVHPALDQLDRDALLKRVVCPLGEIDGAHAAASDLADDAVGADPSADRRALAGCFDEAENAFDREWRRLEERRCGH